MQWTSSRNRKFSAPSDVISPALAEMCSRKVQSSNIIQAASTPSVFFESDFDDYSKKYSCGESNSNLSDISTNTMDTQVTSKFRPSPLTLKDSNLKLVGSSHDITVDFDEEDLLTPKILPISRTSSREHVPEGPVFFISDIPDTQPSSREMKEKIDKAITNGSAYLQLPTAVERRRHSWMSG